jgi:hypothetical protein
MYKITRLYRDKPEMNRLVKKVATLEEAQEHCRNPETSSSTATTKEARERTRLRGDWFDSYEECVK